MKKHNLQIIQPILGFSYPIEHSKTQLCFFFTETKSNSVVMIKYWKSTFVAVLG